MMSDSLSLSSYKDYPVIHPFINTHTPRHTLPSKAFPESSSTGKVTLILCVCVCVCVFVLESNTQFPFATCVVSGLHGYSWGYLTPLC